MTKNQINIKDYFILKWQPMVGCNYNCSFCCQKKKKDYNIDNILLNSKLIKEKIIDKINSDILLSMSGGELSIIDINIFLEILNNLYSDKIKIIYITSNFSNSSEYYNKIYKWCFEKNIEFLLEISFHEEFTKEEIFFNKIKELSFKPCNIQAVVTSKNTSFMKQIKERHPEIFFEPNYFELPENIDFDFSNEELKRNKNKHSNENFGKKCFQKQVSVKENGDVYNNNCKLLKYGNLNSNVKIPSKEFYITCSNTKCNYCNVQDTK